ncbi:Metal-dependent hydrolase, endonuclease/exonuclease/phosphatase family [Mariniphaga anaerophila]|uniref:Metal-dependent hydrolase, endonuclease/exonuclease/phosphatase family n=1 Tax=Mariniphaga anaerophila TaxID=1484053 RepID=A0A1M4TQY2_9BACT|nr:endonuclease/exonuclease/phosphatase family protein [Mariniphaga anaerophila]SHE46920.1 Metal-dependent hydrolase, endonuclease/exonuclease/phosphatase family [Mariniphaga anaerophila]
MKKILGIILLLIPATLFSQQMNIVSFNIRYNTPNDGENAWPNRIEMVSGLLRFHEADIFGLQEALHGQIIDLQNELPEYEWFGVGRDDGEKGGEFSPIFFKKSKFILIDHGTYWLSETPEKPSKGWDAALNRIITWGHFQSKVTGKQFLVFNTHFDHIGVEARKNSAILIRKKIEDMTRGKNLPVVLTGDFNLTPEQEPIVLLKKYMKDSYEVTQEPPYGPVGTFQQFKIESKLDHRIDYVFVHGGISVLKYAALTDFKNHRFPSDHLPVFVKVQLK